MNLKDFLLRIAYIEGESHLIEKLLTTDEICGIFMMEQLFLITLLWRGGDSIRTS